jgi:replicative DNA helicase
MNRKTGQTRRQTEIQRLSRNIEQLATQLNLLIIEENQENQEREQEQLINYQIGDRVEITNNYRGLRGTQGIVTHVTPQQVTIRAEGHRRVITKKKTNVRRITAAADNIQEE